MADSAAKLYPTRRLPDKWTCYICAPMRYRPLGRTGLEVSEIGFGAWGIGRLLWRGADDRESLRALHQAADQGLTFIDTALAYGRGHSESLIGRFLAERRDRIMVATKVPPANGLWPAQGTVAEAFPREHVIACAEQSLHNLGVERLDLLQLHVWSPDWIHQDEWHTALVELQASGKVAHFGVSADPHAPETAVEIVRSRRIDTVQVIYNIFDQSPDEELLGACQESGVGVIARVPFDEGALTGEIRPETTFARKDWRNRYFSGDRKQQVQDRVERLSELLGDEVQTLPELALCFCLQSEAVSTVIPGMRTSAHVVSNLAVSGLPPLSPELMQVLRRHAWQKNFY